MALHKLRFHPQFVNELEIAIAFYNVQSKKVGTKFKQAIKKQLELIKKNPTIKSVRYDDVRYACIDKFPYSIHYSIDTETKCVLVYHILCDYQNPDVNRIVK